MIEDFLSHLQVERRMSAHTLDAYRRDLTALADWAAGQGTATWPNSTAEQLRAFIAAEHRRGLSPKSLQRRLSACRSYFNWLLKHGRIAANPAAAIARAEVAAQVAAGAGCRRGLAPGGSADRRAAGIARSCPAGTVLFLRPASERTVRAALARSGSG